jgi:shikimate kinase
VVLVGVPGSGKTTVGTLLARRLAVEFRDTDEDIALTEGKPVPDIFVDSGEPHFRALERDAVARALREHDGVLALGGGAVLDPGTRALLVDHPTVWLQVGAAAGAHRVGLDVPRPVLLGNVRGRLAALVAERAPLYAEVARITVDTDGLAPEAVADAVASGLGLEAHDG